MAVWWPEGCRAALADDAGKRHEIGLFALFVLFVLLCVLCGMVSCDVSVFLLCCSAVCCLFDLWCGDLFVSN